MLSSRFLRPQGNEKHGRMYQITEAGYVWLVGKYESSLLWVMRHRKSAVAFSLLILVGTGGLFAIIPKGFIPSQDIGQMFATTETAQGTSFDDMMAHQRAVAAIIQQDTNVSGFMSAIGGSSTISGANQGRLFIGLKERSLRLGVDDIIKELRPKLATVPGIVVYMQNPRRFDRRSRVEGCISSRAEPDIRRCIRGRSWWTKRASRR
jgi:HAE1 family hydrophobic/amphiphilic exporter-1